MLGLAGNSVVAQGSKNAVGANPIGKPITVYNADREEAAEITLVEIEDPFEDYEEYGEPQRDERFILVTVKVEVTGERPFEFQPYNLSLLDSLGHLQSRGFISRTDKSTVANPDLEEGNLLPGEEVIGALPFNVAADAELTQLVYSGYNDVQVLYLVADLTAEPEA